MALNPATAQARRLIQPASALLDTATVQALHAASGSSAIHFAAVYQPLLQAVAEYVQQLPDPGQPTRTVLEARVHAALGGLRRRRGRLLPPGAPAERIAQETEVWTYAVFSLALLRGLAPVVTAWRVTLWSAQAQPLGVWRLWDAPGGLAQVPRAAAYTVQPALNPPEADATPLLIGALMPAAGLHWLWRAPAVGDAWRAALRAAAWPALLQPLFSEPGA
jgi:hypothetical protein